MRKLSALIITLCLLGSMPAVSAAEAGAAGLSLPAPTGRDAVGRTTLALTDRGRTDPWVPESGPRRLMVTLFYPAVRGTGSRAPYLDKDEAAALSARFHEDAPQLTAEKLIGTRTWSRVGANPLPGKRPLVLLSPGFNVPRHTLTSLAEDLASRGYVAAAVDHAFESSSAKFPGGVLPCSACGLPDKIGRAPIALSRATDLSFVLDELRGNPLIDQRRVAVVGHSLGGAAAATAMRADRRVDAGVNLDGPMEPVAALDRPFLLVGSPEIHDPAATKDPSWEAVWPMMTGWKRRLTMAGADHYAFTDLDLLVQQAGFEDTFPLDPALGIRLTRSYVAAFLDRHLCGGASPTMGLGAADIVG
ncbi:alpha/beta hydrolase family protein [Amycolatopsis sp. NPDC059657]|uniref:alpha/beta hydrolase family protein n=1 Tax=Amycolatopsis sp. NPDC059657 TaxID=3346899 RepID=UPI003670C9C7